MTRHFDLFAFLFLSDSIYFEMLDSSRTNYNFETLISEYNKGFLCNL